MSDDFAAVRALVEDKLYQSYYGLSTNELPARMQPRSEAPSMDPDTKVDWDGWRKWEWLQPGYKGPKLHIIVNVQKGDNSQATEVRSAWM
mmetsp:Transcript_41990/g.76285  ORF Transcript_41990/g.76285 Transcript_41990/m.76285 type:complete len:90 (+) Transcript_41990:68-337(+)